MKCNETKTTAFIFLKINGKLVWNYMFPYCC